MSRMESLAGKTDGSSRTSPSAYAPPGGRVHMFCEDAGTAETASKLFAGRRFAALDATVRKGGIQAAIAAYAGAPTPDLVIVESTQAGAGILAELETLANVCDAGTRVIVIGHINDVLLYRELMRRGISDYLVAPLSPGQLGESIRAALTGQAGETRGRIVAFLGAKGGCGSSTACHNTAWLLAEAMKAQTVIADFDLAFGTLGLDFNQDSGHGLGDALAACERLDTAMIVKLTSKCSDHLGLVTAPCILDAECEITAGAATHVIGLLSQAAAFVMLDLPHAWNAWSRAMIEAASHVVITAEPDLANLRNTKNVLDALLRHSSAEDKPPILMLNKVGLPRRPEISVRDFANAVDLEPAAVIEFDAQLFGTAANNGLMIGEVSPKARALAPFRQLAGILSGKAPGAKPERGFVKPLIDRLSRRRIA